MADIPADYINFIERIAEGEFPEAAPEQLDALLHWMAGRRNEKAEAVATAFEFHEISRDKGRQYIMIYLDATLFARERDSYRLFGLTPDCEFAAIRARHKQLMQVMHPDRHDDNQAWFTERSERINHAYADLKAHHGLSWKKRRPDTVTSPSSARRQPRAPNKAPSPSPWQTLFANRDRLRRQLRKHLGNPASLEKRVYIILVAVPVVLLIVVYVHQADFIGPDEQVIVMDATRNTGGQDRVPVTAYHLPDARGKLQANAQSRVGDARPRIVERPVDVVPLQPDPALPVASLEYPIRMQTFDQPGFGIAAAADLIGYPPAAATVDPEPTETGIADIPVADSATDVELYSESRAPVSVAAVETGRAIVATETLSLDDAGDHSDAATSGAAPGPDSQSTPDTATGGEATTQTTGTEPAVTPGDTQRDEPAHQAAAADPGTAEPDDNTTAARDPEPAEQPDLAQADDTQQVARAAPRPGLPEIRAFLDQYQSAYNLSDIEHFSRLFHRNATSRSASSRAEITEQYQSLFNRTRDRTLALRNVRIHQVGQGRYRVRTHYTVQWTYPDGETKTDSGEFRMLLTTKTGTILKIKNLDFE